DTTRPIKSLLEKMKLLLQLIGKKTIIDTVIYIL
ncbi:MAG: hypothetical protein RLZZ333_1832, partial [Bacteroidota bacterium]